MDSKHQPHIHGSAHSRDGNPSREKPIRLNDLIPKKDAKAGRRTVFGAIQAKAINPQNQKDK